MSALSKFLDRHGLDGEFRARAAFAASAGVIAAATLFAPLKAKAEPSFNPELDSPIGGSGMAQRLGMLADRTTDRLADMQAINRALHEMPDLVRGRDGDLAARIVVEINNRLYRDTPHPHIADFDMTRVTVPGTVEEGASMEYAASAINYQKKTLADATEALQSIVDAYRFGDRQRVNAEVNRLDDILSGYAHSHGNTIRTIRESLREMTMEEGWVRGKQVDF